jgi:hypothetical protein
MDVIQEIISEPLKLWPLVEPESVIEAKRSKQRSLVAGGIIYGMWTNDWKGAVMFGGGGLLLLELAEKNKGVFLSAQSRSYSDQSTPVPFIHPLARGMPNYNVMSGLVPEAKTTGYVMPGTAGKMTF